MSSNDDNDLRRRKAAPTPVGGTDLVSVRTGIPTDMEEYAADMHRTKSREEREEEAAKLHLLTSMPTWKREKERQARKVRKHHFQRGRYWLGLRTDARIKQHHYGSEQLLWSRIRAVMQEPFSEFLGVLVFTLVQQGGLAQATLGADASGAPGGEGYGVWLTVPFCTGIGVLLGVYIAGDSGSYLNPAITFANCLFRGLPWRSFPILMFAQTLGAFIGTGITYGIYQPAIEQYSGGALLAPPDSQATAPIFTSFPQTFSSRTSQFFSVVQRTAIMQCVVVALKDDYNLGQKSSPGGSTNFPMNLFFLFFALTASNGWQTAGQANPALDLGGRCMASVIGYPNTIWTLPYTFSGYPWIPTIVPFIGACFGAWLYDVLVFTGVSPVNTPEMGVKKLYSPMLDWSNRKERLKQRKDPETAMP
ncbi:hypothetical protein KC340_g13985 [Hortaea werneckii]|nr:hypothetical protein KC342_g2637 [Hortaea werneckii]KAI7108417.1 hypothetical protein KC339_g1595 [Hortaea werneckii]KAI7220255.1 hypothetical protein KC365_g12072 [Hortaea werneckii]KAI7299071.1 hypothetical protein KC340_g13985 [Hortaea werneckii]KAI7393148.1 hypothetical protein KC328_g6741 [Hortaea werneckii]